jgi:hypothetical protein
MRRLKFLLGTQTCILHHNRIVQTTFAYSNLKTSRREIDFGQKYHGCSGDSPGRTGSDRHKSVALLLPSIFYTLNIKFPEQPLKHTRIRELQLDVAFTNSATNYNVYNIIVIIFTNTQEVTTHSAASKCIHRGDQKFDTDRTSTGKQNITSKHHKTLLHTFICRQPHASPEGGTTGPSQHANR